MAYVVLVSDPLAEEGLERLKSYPDVEVEVHTDWDEERLEREIGRFDALLVRSGTQVTARIIDAGTRLKAIGRAGVGVDNIDVDAATKKGIIVINSPDGNTLSAAEHTVALMLSLARQIPQAHHALVHERQWNRSRFTGVQIAGKALGVVGLGRIGSEVARRAIGLDMRVLGYDPYISPERAKQLGVELVDLDTLCREADFITVHVPLTKQNAGLIGAPQFALMKRGVRLINAARGGIVDEGALYDAIKAGIVHGAALDVFSQEPPIDNPLLDLPQVIATPHLGASTYEAQISVAVDVAEAIVKALRGEPVATAVNAPMFKGDNFERVAPYLDLCERLGRLFTGLFGGGFERVEIAYRGSAAAFDSRALTPAVLKGMLDPVLHEQVNYINAKIFAEERGIHVTETKESRSPVYENLITITGHGKGSDMYVSGTVAQGGGPTLVDISGYRLNISGSGLMLIARNEDRPGIIGIVGTVLGRANVNIAFMQVGRKVSGGDAVMVLGVDTHIDDELLAELNQIEALSDIRLVEW